jgi:O-antigen ligase
MPDQFQNSRPHAFELPGDLGRSGAVPGNSPLSMIGFAIALSFVAILVLNSQSIYVRLAIPTVLAGIVLYVCVRVTLVDPLWLGCALVLTESLPYVNLIPTDPESRWWLHYPMFLAFCVPAIPLAIRSGILKRGCFWGFLIFFGLGALSVIYSIDPTISMGRLVPEVLIFVALATASASVRTDGDIRNFFLRFLFACAALLALNLFVLFAYPGKTYIEGSASFAGSGGPPIGVYPWVLDISGIVRFTGLWDNPNFVGSLMMAVVGVAAVLFRTTRRWSRFALVCCVLVSLVLAALADSRSSIAVLAVGAACYSIWKHGFRGVMVCVVAVLIAAIVYGSLSSGDRVVFNRGLDTATGRTVAWHYEIRKVEESPLIGYGYQVEGAIFQGRTFPSWQEIWARGPNTSLHEGYLSVAVGMGIPALLLWLYLILKPWISVLSSADDPWNLKPIFFLIVIPMLLRGFDETGVAYARSIGGVLFYFCWMLAECQRLSRLGALEAEPLQGMRRFEGALSSRSAGVIMATGLATLLCAATVARAADYYVAANGDDASSGTSPAAPWRTIAKVDHYPFHPGDVVHLHAGSVWRAILAPQVPGAANFQGLTFTRYGTGAPPMIKGSDVISRWRRFQGSIYAAPVSTDVFDVYVDGGPGWGLLHACCTDARPCSASQPRRFSKGQNCWIGQMRSGSWYRSGSDALPPEAPDTLYVWLPNGDSPSSHRLEAVTRKYGIYGYALSNQLDNLTIDGISVEQTGLRGISLESRDSAGCCGSRGTGKGKGISGLVVRNCTILNTGTGTFDDGSYGNAITIINATGPDVENDKVSYAGNHGNCINVQNAKGARIIGNDVSHWNHNGIDIKGSSDVMVSDNVAHDQPAIGAGFYTEYSRNVIFSNNLAYNVSNGFQISASASARVVNNRIRTATTGVYFGPRGISLRLEDNQGSDCRNPVSGDGRGLLTQSNNTW